MPTYDSGYGRNAGFRGEERGGSRGEAPGGYGRGYDRDFAVGYDPNARDPSGDPRPWVGGYTGEYQGGSGGISVNTTRGSFDYGGNYGGGRSTGARGGGGYDREVRRDRYDRGFTGYDREQRGGGNQPAWQRLEQWRPRYSPVGGMHPAMGGSFKFRGEQHRATGYDGWYNQRTRWF